MKKLLSYLTVSIEIVVRSAYFFISIAIILTALYMLGGYSFITGLWGTDFQSALAMLVWIDKFFPDVPFWYPLAGGGISITHSYPTFSFFLSSFIHHISSLNLIQSFTLLGLLSIVSMSISIYVFVALRFKNQTAALIASIFYLISPISWTWLTDWGFYAESISHIFVGPSILFWDLFFVNFIKRKWGFSTRLYLLLTIIFLFLAMGTHFIVGFALIRLFIFYVIGFALLAKQERKKILLRGFIALLLVGITALLATLPFSIPFSNYSKIGSEVGLTGLSYEQAKQSIPSPLTVMGFTKVGETDFLYSLRNFSFPAVVSTLALISLLFSITNKRYFSIALYAIFGFTIPFNADYMYYLYHHGNPIFTALFIQGTSHREMFIILRFMWPILAALAITSVLSTPFFWLKNRYLNYLKAIFVAVLSIVLCIFLLYTYTPKSYKGYLGHVSQKGLTFNQKPNFFIFEKFGARKFFDTRNIFGSKYYSSILQSDICASGEYENNDLLEGGVNLWCDSPMLNYFVAATTELQCRNERGKAERPILCYPDRIKIGEVLKFWNDCKDNPSFSSYCKYRIPSIQEQLDIRNWPSFELKDKYDPNSDFNNKLKAIEEKNPVARIDFAPEASYRSMLAQYYNFNRDLSQMHIYIAPSSLILRFQGWQQLVFYKNLPQFNNPKLLNNLANWFGINYAFLGSDTNTKLYKEAGWEMSDIDNLLYEYPETNKLVELSNKHIILAIGQRKFQAYDQVLSGAFLGAIPYNDAYIIWGKDNVDDYSLEELKNYNSLILEGYNYRNKSVTNGILKQYIEQGGNVFIDTGWQYTVPDWQSKNSSDVPLEIIPFKKLSWKDLGKTSNFLIEDESFFLNSDPANYNPLIYGDQSWSVSTSDKSDLKDWANVILSAEGYPLVVAGQLGKGRVVWSGMNLFIHAKPGSTVFQDEINLLQNLFSWLNVERENKLYDVEFSRTEPDKVDFEINEDISTPSYLLWKEVYYPNFNAKLIRKNSSIQKLSSFRAGPGFTLIKVPEAIRGDRIVWEYDEPYNEKFSILISLLIFVFIFLVLIEGIRGKKSIIYKLSDLLKSKVFGRLSHVLHKQKDNIIKNNEEEDY